MIYEQSEGQITKRKLVKRQMYGRGKLDLLKPVSRRCKENHREWVKAPR